METTEIAAIIQRGEYRYYGIRVIDADTLPEVGSYAAPSRVWDDEGQWTDETMDGAAALSVGYDPEWDAIGRTIAASTYYGGDVVMLLGGNGVVEGQDRGEIVMRNAKILAAWFR